METFISRKRRRSSVSKDSLGSYSASLTAASAHSPAGVFAGSSPSFGAATVSLLAGSSVGAPPSLAAASVSLLAGNSVTPSPGLAAALGPAGSPHTVPIPVELIAAGSLKTGMVADSVSAAVLEVSPQDPKCDLQGLTDFNEEESTDYKLSILISLHPDKDEGTLLETLLASEGSVERALECLNLPPKKRPAASATSYQSSLSSITRTGKDGAAIKQLTKKGKTVHLYTPEDIEAHTPCSIIYNFLPPEEADALLQELVDESPTYKTNTFQLFDRVVSSPHTFCLYVDSWGEAEIQKTQYVYDGEKVKDVRRSLPRMRDASHKVRETVNQEITRRIRSSPTGQKLHHQSPVPWAPNTAFVNCYDGPRESVGYHSDHLTYLGPRPVIGSLSLGVAREFRVRKIVATDDDAGDSGDSDAARKRADAKADAQGQLSIHLPHNSLLVMHASMQEEWKHSIAPARTVSPHPISGNKRINITYRHYKANLHPRFTPKCGCGVPTVLRVVQRQAGNRGKYMWMCYAGYVPGKEGCKFFEWAVFDEDGEPPWADEAKGGEKESSDAGEKFLGENDDKYIKGSGEGKGGALGSVDEG